MLRSLRPQLQRSFVPMADLTEPVAAQSTTQTAEEETLPKLSMADYRVYNSMAEHMEYYVSIFIDLVMAPQSLILT